MLLGLTDDLVEHGCHRGLESRQRKTNLRGLGLSSLPTEGERMSLEKLFLLQGENELEGRRMGGVCRL